MPSVSPNVNLLVIRSPDIHHAVTFYEAMGLSFEKHRHGKGPEHYSTENYGFVFEIYPAKADKSTTATRFGFRVTDIDGLVASIKGIGAEIVSEPSDSEWGRRAVVRDFDGHTIELLSG